MSLKGRRIRRVDYIKNADKSVGKYMNFIGEEDGNYTDIVV